MYIPWWGIILIVLAVLFVLARGSASEEEVMELQRRVDDLEQRIDELENPSGESGFDEE